jgi:hypothetical protein
MARTRQAEPGVDVPHLDTDIVIAHTMRRQVLDAK